MVCVVSTNYFRYFGTGELRKKFEDQLKASLKIELLSSMETKDFLSIKIHQELEAGTVEAKQPA